jgi:hypothetical protein
MLCPGFTQAPKSPGQWLWTWAGVRSLVQSADGISWRLSPLTDTRYSAVEKGRRQHNSLTPIRIVDYEFNSRIDL